MLLQKVTAAKSRPSAAARAADLRFERRALNERIILLEAEGVRATPDAAVAIHEKALALVNGQPESAAALAASDPGGELQALHERKENWEIL